MGTPSRPARVRLTSVLEVFMVVKRINRNVVGLAACLTFLLVAFTSGATAQTNEEWTRPYAPFRIVGNIYWVGTYDLSSYLITSPQGHILINTGLPDSVAQIKANVEKVGFKLSDIKILTATHAHWDHVAGLAEIKKLTGAQMLMAEPDADVLESGGKTDFRWGQDPGSHYAPVKVDRKLKDGDRIALGNIELTLHIHAGHTKGASSFTTTISENGKTYRVGIVNMGSINPGVKVSGMPGFPGIKDAYARTFQRQKQMQIDVFLASHAAQFRMHEKHKPGDPYTPDRFIDPAGFRDAVERLEKAYLDQLAKERAGKP
jgi:metallo-beta-lactamase class B